MNYLLDSNLVSDYLSGNLPEKGMLFADEIFDSHPIISVISKIELLGHNLPNYDKYKLAVENCIVLEIDAKVLAKTIALKKSRKIKTPDAIIAATALVHDLILITHNLKDFTNISDLKVLDLHN